MSPTSNDRAGRGSEVALAVLAALVAGGAGGYLTARRGASPAAGTTETGARGDRITALGKLQPASGVVPIYGPPSDRIAKLYPDIAPGKKLEANAPIADLESAKDRQQEVRVAKVQL